MNPISIKHIYYGRWEWEIRYQDIVIASIDLKNILEDFKTILTMNNLPIPKEVSNKVYVKPPTGADFWLIEIEPFSIRAINKGELKLVLKELEVAFGIKFPTIEEIV